MVHHHRVVADEPSETSPLLNSDHDSTVNSNNNNHHQQQNGYAVDSEDARPAADTNDAANGQSAEDEIVLAEEPSTKRLLVINSALWTGVFFAALDTTIVATLSGPISSSFSSLSLLSWIATGYLIASSACQPLSGKLTDIFSRRTGLIFSNIFFGVGTLICGLAPNAGTMIAGRVIAGVGGGGLNSISTFVSSDLIPLRRRGLWQGFGNLVFGLGAGLGGTFGGLCADSIGWRWAFLIQVPFIVVSAVMVWFLVDIPVNPSKQKPLSRIDFLGAGLLVSSLVLLLFGVNTGGNQLPWKHPVVIASLVAAAVTMAAFLWVESSPSIVPEPIIPVSLIIRTRTVLAACMVNWLCTMSAYIVLYYVPLYLQTILHTSSTAAGLRTIPFAAGISLGSLGSGLIMRLTGRYYFLVLVVMLIYIAGSALTITFSRTTPSWATFLYIAPMGLGYGSMLTITLVGMISAVPHEHQAVITAASYAFRSTGSSIGITVAGAVFQNILTRELRSTYRDRPGAEKVIRRIRDSLDEIEHLPKGWDRNTVEGIYMHGFRGSFVAALGLGVLAFLVALAMKEHQLHKNLARK